MVLNIQRILQLFALFSDLSDQELYKWKGLCGASGAAILTKLRDGADIKANMERLCTAAAAWAYSDYLMLTSGGGSDEVRVGDISLKNAQSGAGYNDAQEIRLYFMGQISDLVEIGSGFAFRRTGESA